MRVLLGMPNGPQLLPIPLLTGSGYLECRVENVSVAASRFEVGEEEGRLVSVLWQLLAFYQPDTDSRMLASFWMKSNTFNTSHQVPHWGVSTHTPA